MGPMAINVKINMEFQKIFP